MSHSIAQAINPIARFREIYQAFGAGSRWWDDNAWLRFAAQAAVMRPAAPTETARAIQAIAGQLAEHVRWYEAMATPLNLVVAATLVQISETAEFFTAALDAAHGLFRQCGLTIGGAHLVKTVLALHVLSDGHDVSEPVVLRMQQIYGQMKVHHWWLTGGDDVTTCALLATCAGTPEEIAGQAEGSYRHLHEQGFASGNDLRTAANILPLSGLPAPAAAARFLALGKALLTSPQSLWSGQYDALALLSLLDHDPARVVTRLAEMTGELSELEPVEFAEVNFNVAADLVFLDLVRFDKHLHSFSGDTALARMYALIRMQRAASLLLVKVPAAPVMVGNTSWPFPPTM